MARKATPSSAPFDPEKKKARIAGAAIGIFAEKGIARAKMAEIAAAAGVGKGTIYEYFRSKDELFEYAVNHFFQKMWLDLESVVSELDDPVEQLKAMIRTTFESIAAAGAEAHIMFEIWAEGVRSGVQYFDLGAMYTTYRASISAILQRGMEAGRFRSLNPDMIASTVIAALDGLLLQWILDEDVIDLKTVAGELVDLLLNGLIDR